MRRHCGSCFLQHHHAFQLIEKKPRRELHDLIDGKERVARLSRGLPGLLWLPFLPLDLDDRLLILVIRRFYDLKDPLRRVPVQEVSNFP